MLYVGKGIKNYAIEGLKVDNSIKSKHSGTWIFGIILLLAAKLLVLPQAHLFL